MAKIEVNFTLTAQIEESRVDDVKDTLAVRYGWAPECGKTKVQVIQEQLLRVMRQDYLSAKKNVGGTVYKTQAESDFEKEA